MVFDHDDLTERDCDRYTTLADAVAGHAAMVTLAAATVTAPTVTDTP